MPKIIIKFDLEKDAWNWWHACNKVSHGVSWQEKINQALSQKLVGKSQAQAFEFLLPYLKGLYSKLDYKIEDYINVIQKGFDECSEGLFTTMSGVTKHQIYRSEFTCFITSFPRFPYDYERGQVWISHHLAPDHQLQIFIHELLHFQFFAYYGERVWNELGAIKHARLKEAMTIILNDEFKNITVIKDEGYEIDQGLRLELVKIWRQSKDMNKFIDRAIELMRPMIIK